MSNNIEHLFLCLFTICIYLGENICSHFCSFSNWIAFLLLSFESILYSLDTRPLSDLWFAGFFSQTVACFFILLTETFAEQKFFICEILDLISILYFSWLFLTELQQRRQKCHSTGGGRPGSPDSPCWHPGEASFFLLPRRDGSPSFLHSLLWGHPRGRVWHFLTVSRRLKSKFTVLAFLRCLSWIEWLLSKNFLSC